MDEAIGDLVAALKRRGLYENTLIAFSSDVSACHWKWQHYEPGLPDMSLS